MSTLLHEKGFYLSWVDIQLARVDKNNICGLVIIRIKYKAKRATSYYKLYVGYKQNQMNEVSDRFYLKYLNLRYVNSKRDLAKYIFTEKKHLLRLAQEIRDNEQIRKDEETLNSLSLLAALLLCVQLFQAKPVACSLVSLPGSGWR